MTPGGSSCNTPDGTRNVVPNLGLRRLIARRPHHAPLSSAICHLPLSTHILTSSPTQQQYQPSSTTPTNAKHPQKPTPPSPASHPPTSRASAAKTSTPTSAPSPPNGTPSSGTPSSAVTVLHNYIMARPPHARRSPCPRRILEGSDRHLGLGIWIHLEHLCYSRGRKQYLR